MVPNYEEKYTAQILFKPSMIKALGILITCKPHLLFQVKPNNLKHKAKHLLMLFLPYFYIRKNFTCQMPESRRYKESSAVDFYNIFICFSDCFCETDYHT